MPNDVTDWGCQNCKYFFQLMCLKHEHTMNPWDLCPDWIPKGE